VTPAADLGALAKLAEGREAEIFAWDDVTVLRLLRDPDAGVDAERELAALRAVRQSLPLVPEARGRVEVEGRPGVLMERIAADDLLAVLTRAPWRMSWGMRLLGEVHARLHAIAAPSELPPLREQIADRLARSPRVPPALAAYALDLLDALPDGESLCHGDFHPGNVLLTPRGPVVIDWGHAARGDAVGDLGRTSLMLRRGSLPPGTPTLIRAVAPFAVGAFGAGYRRAYLRVARADPARLRRWEIVRAVDRLVEGIPEEREGLLREIERSRAAGARGAP
jgi:aminoglycoside phosphotransferase (APT) family kinase protein